ncbi:MAG: glutamyl-tRNA reductase [candidate division NC10 bacterium]|nr:glutamyl-tRNA reductase [candidate division NC10 bacterium]
MEIIALGVSHKTAPVELRERLHISDRELPQPLALLGLDPMILERLILSTCNRVEVYAVVREPAAAKALILDTLAAYRELPRQAFQDTLYLHVAEQAVRHLFRVTSSLDSMVVGEPQILGQVKAAYQVALEQGATGTVLNHLVEWALLVGKRVRTETGIAQAACSVPSAAVELAKRIFGDLHGRTALILGAGEMAEVAALHLKDEGVTSILVSNRSADRAHELAHKLQGKAIPFAEVKEELVHADVVLSSTGAPHYVLYRPEVETVLRLRKHRPIFLIDIAVPRDIDPAVNDLDNVYLYDIDDLEGVVRANLKERQKEAERAEAIIENEVGRFLQWLKGREVVPTIVSLREKVEAIRAQELEKAFGRLGRLTQEERAAVEALTTSLVNKILHAPMAELKKQAASGNSLLYVGAFRRLFELKEELIQDS